MRVGVELVRVGRLFMGEGIDGQMCKNSSLLAYLCGFPSLSLY
jgi:hypothetical protein